MPEDENIREFWDDVQPSGAQSAAIPRFGEHPGDLIIGTSRDRILVRIHPDGTLTYGPEYTPDEAAVEFWTQMAIRRLESEERIIHLGVMEMILMQVGRADFAYQEAQVRARQEGASEHDRFMEEMSRRSLETMIHQAVESGRGLIARPNPSPPVPGSVVPAPPLHNPFTPTPDMVPGIIPHVAMSHEICTTCTEDLALHATGAQHCTCGAPWGIMSNMCSYLADIRNRD